MLNVFLTEYKWRIVSSGGYPSWVIPAWAADFHVLQFLPRNIKTLSVVPIGGPNVDFRLVTSTPRTQAERFHCDDYIYSANYIYKHCTATYWHRKALIQTKFRLTGKYVSGFQPNHSLEHSCSWQWLQSFSLEPWPYHFWDPGEFHRPHLKWNKNCNKEEDLV